MGKTTGIEWAEATWNPWQGCTKVDSGCRHCYMYREKERWGQDPTVVVRSKDRTFKSPLRWKDPRLVFVCSWSDFFHEEADPWRAEAWDIIEATPQHFYLLLTKRENRIRQQLPWHNVPWPNVGLGVSIASQDHIDRLYWLKHVPAVLHFVSMEPMIDRVTCDWDSMYNYFKREEDGLGVFGPLDWMIVGGESAGPKEDPRPLHPDWVRQVRKICRQYSIPFFFKQWGEYQPYNDESGIVLRRDGSTFTRRSEDSERETIHDLQGVHIARVGKRKAGRMLDGKEHSEMPAIITDYLEEARQAGGKRDES